METRIKKVFNLAGSHVIVLPKRWCKELGISYGDHVALVLRDNDLVVITRMGEEKNGNQESGRPH